MIGFEELYRLHAPEVHRFALGLSGDRDEAEDLVSETFIRAWTCDTDLRVETVRGYLFVIARNLFVRRRERSRRYVPLEDRVSDGNPGPIRSAEQRDELRATLEDMQSLPEVDRAAVLMRAEHGLPYEEIARCLSLTVSAAKVKVHRARIKLAARRVGRGVKP